MAIYVDDAVWPYRGSLYCHMMTDGSMDELHAFAHRLGLKRSWFQRRPGSNHYDLSQGKRWQAIRLGALPVSSRVMLERCRKESKYGT